MNRPTSTLSMIAVLLLGVMIVACQPVTTLNDSESDAASDEGGTTTVDKESDTGNSDVEPTEDRKLGSSKLTPEILPQIMGVVMGPLDNLFWNLQNYITFDTTTIEGMPDQIEIGDTIQFRIAGNLTMRNITHSETFDIKLTLNSENELSGLAGTTILHDNYE